MCFRRRYNSNKAKLEMIQKIEQAQTKLSAECVTRVVMKLDEIVEMLDNKYVFVGENQADIINQSISSIERYAKKSYEELLLKKCETIKSAIKDELEYDMHTMTELQNEERLYEMQSELSEIASKVTYVEKRMSESLGKDKNTWTMLNSERTRLKNRELVLKKNYQMLLESQQTLAVAKDVKESKRVSEEIMRQNTLDSVVEFEDNVEYTTLASEETRENSEKVQSVFSKAFGSGLTDDYEYERAVEQMLSEAKLSKSQPQKSTEKASND